MTDKGPELITDEWDRDRCQHIYLPTWTGGVIRHCRYESKYYYKGGKFCGHHTPGVGSRKREPVTYRIKEEHEESDIDNMPAGAEMDALVEEQVMGGNVSDKELDRIIPVAMRSYSTDILAAWLVVNRFRYGWNRHVAAVVEMRVTDVVGEDDCECRIFGPDLKQAYGKGGEMPLAICRAALDAWNTGKARKP